MSTPKGTEKLNEEGAAEVKVDTVDYRSPAGEDKEPKKEDVEIIHEIKDGPKSGDGDNAFAKATAAVSNTFQSAKDAISGTGKDHKTTE